MEELDYLNDPEFRELTRNYLQYLVDTLPEVKTNLSDGNFPAVQKFGHDLKGTGGGYGFDEFTQLGGQIEQASKEQDNDLLRGLVLDFESKLNHEYKHF